MDKRTSFHLFVVALVVLLAATLSGTYEGQARERANPRYCRFQAMHRGSWTPTEVRATIRCAVQRWPVSLSTALAIADRESNFEARATNPNGGACGVFQWYPPSTASGRVAQFNAGRSPKWRVHNPSCFNARANVLWSIWYAHHNGWGPWGM